MSSAGTHAQPILSARGVHKWFGAVVALEDVSLDIYPGEVAGLIGDNGAGKSTLIKILSAVMRPDAGSIVFDGREVHFGSPAEARTAGIETVYQDLALAGNMTIWANIFLGRELTVGPKALHLLNKREMASQAQTMLERLDLNVPPIDSTVASLSGGQRQAIAIARAAAWGSKVIILDEPTAALGVAETAAVEDVIAGLKARGFGLVIISHNIPQVFRLCDQVSVLRRGRMIDHCRTAETNMEEAVSLITGAATRFRASRGVAA